MKVKFVVKFVRTNLKPNRSEKCLNCKDNVHIMKSKEFIARLKVISKDLVEGKKKHKTICPVSRNCPDEMACSRNCYFLDLSYVESEPEDSDVDLENDDDEIEDSENGSNKQNVLNKCVNCNFEAKI